MRHSASSRPPTCHTRRGWADSTRGQDRVKKRLPGLISPNLCPVAARGAECSRGEHEDRSIGHCCGLIGGDGCRLRRRRRSRGTRQRHVRRRPQRVTQPGNTPTMWTVKRCGADCAQISDGEGTIGDAALENGRWMASRHSERPWTAETGFPRRVCRCSRWTPKR